MKMQRVIWYEGMKLDPHHFQQTDLYNHYYINNRLGFMNSNLWGIKDLLVDAAALAGGSFSISKCSGIMPDGTIFNMPENDQVPRSRTFDDFFPITADKIAVYLAIPIEHPNGNNCYMDESGTSNSARYSIQNTDITDYNSGMNIRKIGIAKPNFQFRFGDESLEDIIAVQIGEITRNASGKYKMEEKYIFPCLGVSASEILLEHSRNVLGALISKSKELKSHSVPQKGELSITQFEILLMRQTIDSFIPVLNYYLSSGHIHPEMIYTLFLEIIGRLSTFSETGLRVDVLPVYDHRHLTETFEQVVGEIGSLLNIQKSVARRDILIPLKRQAENLYVGQLSQSHFSAQFFIAVEGDYPEKKVISELPKNIKISAYEEILAVHQAGIQGVTMEFAAHPPPGISVNEKAHYFRINKEGRFWEKIIAKKNIALFIASEFKNLRIELILLTGTVQ